MTVRRLRKNQRGPWCSYEEEGVKVRAVHRGCGFTKFACSSCLEKLVADDDKQSSVDDFSDAEFSLPKFI
jgi:hypothetical protein